MMDEIVVLLVDDNRSDVVLLKEALAEAGVSYRLHVARDGVEAMEFLRRREAYADAPRPDLIILDLNLPRKDGREVVADIMPDSDLRRIPLVILTSSTSDRDIVGKYGLEENSYMIKPLTFEEYVALVRVIEAFRRNAVTRL